MTTVETDPLAGFRRCGSAEEYFDFFQLDYDPRVVNVYRLHILRHFADQLERMHRDRTVPESPERILAGYRDALAASYQAFRTGTALDHRLFRVLREHAPDARPEPTFIPLAGLFPAADRSPR